MRPVRRARRHRSAAAPLDRQYRRGVVEESLGCNAVAAPGLQRELVEPARDAVVAGHVEAPADDDAVAVDEQRRQMRRDLAHRQKRLRLMRDQGLAADARRCQVLLRGRVLRVEVADRLHEIAGQHGIDKGLNALAARHRLDLCYFELRALLTSREVMSTIWTIRL